MSLRETYQSRKNLLATNLRQKGVTASGTEGLTTLINKVLDINTISFDGITLTSDKDIISYNGGTQPESAVLTAQLTLDGDPAPVSGETVTFEVRKDSDDSLVETLTGTTNSSGVATVSYLGKHTGSLYIKAFSRQVSSTEIHIIDYYLYDNQSSDKRALYTYMNNPVSSTISYQQNEYYNVSYSKTGETNPVMIKLSDLEAYNWEVSVDILYNYSGTHQHGLYIQNDLNNDTAQACCWTNQKVVGAVINGADNRLINSPILSTNTWYTHKIKYENGLLTAQILNANGSIVTEKTVNGWVNNQSTARIQLSDYITLLRFRNVKIKIF